MTTPNYFPSFTESVGHTPLVRLSRICPGAALFAKHEARNPAGSVKDRVGAAMILDAEARGALRTGMTIIEPTSGNTGIALAAVAATRGYALTLAMPMNMSMERQRLLSALGAELVLTPPGQGMAGAIARAKEMAESSPLYYMPDQFSNPANPGAHYRTTGPEIWEAMQGDVDVLVAGVGTGGTISGVGAFLRERNPSVKIIAVEPIDSPVISQQLAGKPLSPRAHKLQGIGAGFIPKTLNMDIISSAIRVSEAEAFETIRQLAQAEGLLAGISSGAAVYAALKTAANPLHHGKRIAVILPDSSERYLSAIPKRYLNPKK